MRFIEETEVKELRDNPNLYVMNIADCPKKQVKSMDGFSLEKAIEDKRKVFVLFEEGDLWK